MTTRQRAHPPPFPLHQRLRHRGTGAEAEVVWQVEGLDAASELGPVAGQSFSGFNVLLLTSGRTRQVSYEERDEWEVVE